MTRTASPFTTIRSEGALLPPELLSRVADGDADLGGLSPTDYHLVGNERLGEAISRSWNRLVGAWASYEPSLAGLSHSEPGTGLTRERWLAPLFQELGFGRLQVAKAREIEGTDYPISHEWGEVPIHLVGAGVELERRTKGVAGAAKMSPHALVQDYLNRTEALWGIVSNGRELRLLRDNVSLTRQAFLAFDLEAMFSGEVYSDFALLWLACHVSRLEPQDDKIEGCWLERWTQAAQTQGTRALNTLREGVETAISTLGAGFVSHPSNAALREALHSGELATPDYYRELLRLIYRLIFLFVAEDRALLHPEATNEEARTRYGDFYSMTSLRHLAERLRGGPHPDLWQSFVFVCSKLASDEGCEELGLPFLGSSLFSPGACPHLDDANLANRDLLGAVRALAFTTQGRVLRQIDYRNMGSEELGSIYESLLELHPEVHHESGSFTLATAAGNERKTTGSYYTPTSLISELLDTALDPVLAEAASKPDAEAAILDLKVLDPACGSGHFLVAAAHRILLGTTPALLTQGIPDEAFAALEGDDKETVKSLKKRNKEERKGQASLFGEAAHPDLVTAIAAQIAALEQAPDDSPEAMHAKQQAWDGLESSDQLAHAKLIADALSATFVIEKVPGSPVLTQGVLELLERNPEGGDPKLHAAIRDLTDRHRFLHPHLAFPQVFRVPKDGEAPDNPDQGWSGGFDVVVGNPPWEQVELQEREWFAQLRPDIAEAVNDSARKALIRRLAEDDPVLLRRLNEARRDQEGRRALLSASGRFPLCGVGRINTYAVFAELASALIGPSARSGLILPLGIATDHTTKEFFGHIVEQGLVASLHGFENEEHVFAGVHNQFKFCLLTLSAQASATASYSFFSRQTTDLGDPARTFTLSASDFRLLNPNTKTCPVFRSQRDAELSLNAYRHVPVFVLDERSDGNPWRVTLKQGLFNMASDSSEFRSPERLGAEGGTLEGNQFTVGSDRYLPLYEAKMIHHFNHRFGTYSGQTQAQANKGVLPHSTVEELQDPSYRVMPRYWVREQSVQQQLDSAVGWVLGWRKTARNVDERTIIPSVVPRAAVGDTLQLIVSETSAALRLCLLANLGALALDYFARQKHSGSGVSFFVLKQLPLFPPSLYDMSTPWDVNCSLAEWIGDRTLELVCTSEDVVGIATDMGRNSQTFQWDSERRRILRAELDAAFLHLYALDRSDGEYILDTFPLVRRNDDRRYGEFCTKRLVLERFDAIETSIASNSAYVTVLDPPPAALQAAHASPT